MPNPVTHFEIIGKDGKKLQDFYAKLFGWKVDSNHPMNYGIVEAQEGHGTGGGIGAGQGDTSYVTIYVEVDDPQAYLDKAASLGGKILMPVTEIPGSVTFAHFADPGGHMIGIVKSESNAVDTSDEFWKNPSLEELVRQQGVQPIQSARDLAVPSLAGEDADSLIAELNELRSQSK